AEVAGQEPRVQRPAVVGGVPVDVGQPKEGKDRAEVLRPADGGPQLAHGEVRHAGHADAPVAEGPTREPLDGVLEVGGFLLGEETAERSVGPAAPPWVGDQHGVPAGRLVADHAGLVERRRDPCGEKVLVVGRPREQGRDGLVGRRPIDVPAQHRAVRERNLHVGLGQHLVTRLGGRTRLPARQLWPVQGGVDRHAGRCCHTPPAVFQTTQGPRSASHIVTGMSTYDRPFGRYYEDFEVGDIYKHWPGKTITEYDDHLFCMITMNHHPLHTNAWFAEHETVQGKNVVVGNLVYSLVLGMSVPDVSGSCIANLEVESLSHKKPTFHGDTIYAETRVLDKVESKSKEDRGVVTVETKGFNQRGEEVCYFRRKLMVWKKDF